MLGKREIGNLTAFDLLVALMLGEVTDEIVFGDVSMAKGFVAVGVIAAWHLANSWGSYRSKFIDRLTADSARVLVEHGRIKRDALAHERINQEELDSLLRLQGVDDLKEVERATLEPSGHVSVIKEEWARPVQKGDIKNGRQRSAA
jgi:uncharacterized membrane protein YcaP (DUF421 family)